MARTVEDHLKVLVGDLVITVARLSAEVEELREQCAAVPTVQPPQIPEPPLKETP